MGHIQGHLCGPSPARAPICKCGAERWEHTEIEVPAPGAFSTFDRPKTYVLCPSSEYRPDYQAGEAASVSERTKSLRESPMKPLSDTSLHEGAEAQEDEIVNDLIMIGDRQVYILVDVGTLNDLIASAVVGREVPAPVIGALVRRIERVEQAVAGR